MVQRLKQEQQTAVKFTSQSAAIERTNAHKKGSLMEGDCHRDHFVSVTAGLEAHYHSN